MNAEYGNDTYNGQSGGAALPPGGPGSLGPYRSVWQALQDPAINIPTIAGGLHTIRVAGRWYAPGGPGAVFKHDDALEQYSSRGPLSVPQGVKIVYDAQFSTPDANGVLAPVVFESIFGATNSVIFEFRSTSFEPSSRIDGSYINPQGAFLQKFVIRGAGNAANSSDPAIRVQPLLQLPAGVPVNPSNSFMDPHFKGIYFEDNEISIFGRNGNAGGGQLYPAGSQVAVRIERCIFTTSNGSTIQGKAHVLMQSDSGATIIPPAGQQTYPSDAYIDGSLLTVDFTGQQPSGRYDAAVWITGNGFDFSYPQGGACFNTAYFVAGLLITNSQIMGNAAPSGQGINFGLLATGLRTNGQANLAFTDTVVLGTGGSGVWFLKAMSGIGSLDGRTSYVMNCGLQPAPRPIYADPPTDLTLWMEPVGFAPEPPERDSGIVVINQENHQCSSVNLPSRATAVARMERLDVSGSGRHGIFVLNRFVPNGLARQAGSLTKFTALSCKTSFNGSIDAQGVRQGSGIFVHVEQGDLQDDTAIVGNESHDNFLHGIEVSGYPRANGAASGQWPIALSGAVANNLIYNHAGDAQNRANGLRTIVDPQGLGVNVQSDMKFVQNTIYNTIPNWESVFVTYAGIWPTNPTMAFWGNLVPWGQSRLTPLYAASYCVGIDTSVPGRFTLGNVNYNITSFGDPVLDNMGCNALSRAFDPTVDFANAGQYPFQLGNTSNQAVDRVGGVSANPLLGQQMTDITGVSRFINQNLPKCSTEISDAGAYEK